MNSLSRRKFLKISGATVVTAAALAGSAKTIVNAAESFSKKKGLEIIPSYCDLCFWKCGLLAYVKDYAEAAIQILFQNAFKELK